MLKMLSLIIMVVFGFCFAVGIGECSTVKSEVPVMKIKCTKAKTLHYCDEYTVYRTLDL